MSGRSSPTGAGPSYAPRRQPSWPGSSTAPTGKSASSRPGPEQRWKVELTSAPGNRRQGTLPPALDEPPAAARADRTRTSGVKGARDPGHQGRPTRRDLHRPALSPHSTRSRRGHKLTDRLAGGLLPATSGSRDGHEVRSRSCGPFPQLGASEKGKRGARPSRYCRQHLADRRSNKPLLLWKDRAAKNENPTRRRQSGQQSPPVRARAPHGLARFNRCLRQSTSTAAGPSPTLRFTREAIRGRPDRRQRGRPRSSPHTRAQSAAREPVAGAPARTLA